MATPPGLRDLLTDAVWRRMFTTAPRPLASQLTPDAMPWVVYGTVAGPETAAGVRWRVARRPTYPDAYKLVQSLLKARTYIDLCISSRSVEYAPPPGFDWTTHIEWSGTVWCSRCRRPSLFRPTHGRHAVKPLRSDRPRRCYFCGIAEDGMFRRYAPVPLPTPPKKKVS